MKIIDVVQGTPAWIAHRAAHFNASDAPAMMGVSPYKSRSELLREVATGSSGAEPDSATAQRFADGHRFEALARPFAERVIGAELYPVVGCENEYSASFDGLTMNGDITFEHKSLTDDIRACQSASELPEMYRIQMEQQLMISGAGKCLFMGSKWGENNELIEERHFWYEPDLDLRARIGRGWIQFKKDLKEYRHVEVSPAPIGAPVLDLPAVSVQVSGQIVIADNFKVFEAALRDFIDTRLIRKPQTDQDFADLATQIKSLKKAEDALNAAEVAMLSQVFSIDAMKRTKDMLYKLARDNRIVAEKLVETEKANRRGQIIQKAKDAYDRHIEALKQDTGGAWIVIAPPDFAGATKGLRTIASLQDAVDTELAATKIAADATARLIRANCAILKEDGRGFEFLFRDQLDLISKQPDDLRLLVKSRIAGHKEVEQKRLDLEREKIRQEEEAKARASVASPPHAPQMPAQSVVASKPGIKPTAKATGPTDDDIIEVLALHYRVHEMKVIEWLLDMDLVSASERAAEEFSTNRRTLV